MCVCLSALCARSQVAEQIVREAARRLLQPRCSPMDEYDVRTLPHERLVIVVASTTGEGEVPDNMRTLWQFMLRRDLPANALSSLRHASFGLGDSSYPQFNFAAKRLNRRLEQLGSTPLLPIGLGDDQDDLGFEQALTPWLEQLWPAVEALVAPLPPGTQLSSADALPAARYTVELVQPPPRAPPPPAGAQEAAAAPAGGWCRRQPWQARDVTLSSK